MTVILPGGLGQLTPAASTSAWDPAQTSSQITLSNNNLTATGTAGTTGVTRGTTGYTTGKYYFELTMNSINPALVSGFGAISNLWPIANSQGAIGSSIYSLGFQNNNSGWFPSVEGFVAPRAAGLPVPAAGQVLMFALDLTPGNIYLGVNGIWNNNGAGGSSPTTSDRTTSWSGGTWYPATQADNSGGVIKVTLNTRGAFVYPLPSGFLAWG